MNAEEQYYEVQYTKLKARATNFMFNFAVTLAWARLIYDRTFFEGVSTRKWKLEEYYDAP